MKVKGADMDKCTTAIVDAIKGAITGPLVAGRLDKLEKEVAALKARPLQKWAGVHVEGASYDEASLVTRSGILWVSTCATTTTLGVDGSERRISQLGFFDN